MPLDIDGKIPADSIVTRYTLKRYNAQKNGAGHFILEVLSEIKYGGAAELFAHLSDNPDDHEEIWARYCERIAIMTENKDALKIEPTDEQKAQAMKDAINPPEYPVTDENAHEIHVKKYIIEKKTEVEKVEENQIEIPEIPKDEKPYAIVLPSQPEETDGAERTDEIEKMNVEIVKKAQGKQLTSEEIWAGIKARIKARKAETEKGEEK